MAGASAGESNLRRNEALPAFKLVYRDRQALSMTAARPSFESCLFFVAFFVSEFFWSLAEVKKMLHALMLAFDLTADGG